MIYRCLSTFSCKLAACGKLHHALLYCETLSKDTATSIKSNAVTQTSINCTSSNQVARINNHSASSDNENNENLAYCFSSC